jgi:hypothetical protein
MDTRIRRDEVKQDIMRKIDSIAKAIIMLGEMVRAIERIDKFLRLGDPRNGYLADSVGRHRDRLWLEMAEAENELAAARAAEEGERRDDSR